ncbi:hypothetical protein LUZ63_013075 [Rhynchospora breviuscula]|uniref:Apyrase n=1 Tax=Rhynchospora breviuscula TaxID=2022672 RepID=A0A9Q0HKJ7_9POAL|nr:hypothetical protein LUZ63_013075 [Rhynchospora breviuscula]
MITIGVIKCYHNLIQAMFTKPLFLCLFFFLLPLPCIFGTLINLGRRAGVVTEEVSIKLNDTETYVVIFDGGSTGSRLHVFRFDDNIDLLQINGRLEVYDKITPGLSSYAENPDEAANSLIPLLKEALDAVPKILQPVTPIKLGATAGLRLVGEKKSGKILEAVRRLFSNSSLLYKKDWVEIISGIHEGTYFWVAMNYLLGHLGNDYSKTVGVIDLGGGSLQMAYAISDEAASDAPCIGEDYITKHYLKGKNYYLYVHSYLGYGDRAARAEILKSTNDSVNYCIISGYSGKYQYNGATYNARSSRTGSNYNKCRKNVLKALNVSAKCEVKNCTFNGVWSGSGGAGQDKIYIAGAFYYRASDDGIIEKGALSADITLANYKKATITACALNSLEAASTKFPNVAPPNLPYLCMDLMYQYTLLTTGFGLTDKKEVTVIKEVHYRDFYMDAAWPLGSAIEAASIKTTSKLQMRNMYRFGFHK